MKIRDDLIIAQAIEILEQRLRTGNGTSICQANDVRQFLTLNLAEKEHEVFGMMLLDNRHRLITFETPFRGTIDGASVYPREVVKLCLEHNASAVILSHNHPSGIAEPSDADQRITKRLVEALGLIDVRVLDHFVIGGTESISFAERGYL